MRFLAPLALVLASCAAPQGPSDPNLGPEVGAAVEKMYEDLSAKRWDALAAHFLPDASLVFTTPTGPKKMTPTEFIEMVRKKVDPLEVFEEGPRSSVWVCSYKDVALAWSPFEGKEGSKDNVRTWTGIDAFTLLKVDGKWKISQISVYVDRPEPSK